MTRNNDLNRSVVMQTDPLSMGNQTLKYGRNDRFQNPYNNHYQTIDPNHGIDNYN